MYLKRYHQLEISVSGVWRVLRRHHLNRLPTSQRHKPHKERWRLDEKPQPGLCLQVDVKFISPLAGRPKRLYQHTAIDDCTRLRVLRIHERLNQKTAIQFIDLVLDRLPFKVETVQTDNGGLGVSVDVAPRNWSVSSIFVPVRPDVTGSPAQAGTLRQP